MIFWLAIKLINEREADMLQHNKSSMTYTHMLIAAGDEFVLCNEQDYRRASASSEI